MENNSQVRKWNIVINNPQSDENGREKFNHDKIKEQLSKIKSLRYWCMGDEQGETYHTHLYILCKNGIRFNTIKNLFPTAHIEVARGTSEQNREYVQKSGKWSNDEKSETTVEGTFEESGEVPVENQGARNDLIYLYERIKDGLTTVELLEENANYMKNLTDIERVRQELKMDEYKNTFREMQVTYIFGLTGVGKTRYVMEKYGYDEVYRITDYKHPFDGYKGQNVAVFDEFSGNFRIQDMNNYLDGYPLELPCRYVNKIACYEIVYIISNYEFKEIYKFEQNEHKETYNAFVRRIHNIIHFFKDGSIREYKTQDYMNSNIIEIDAANEVIPF